MTENDKKLGPLKLKLKVSTIISFYFFHFLFFNISFYFSCFLFFILHSVFFIFYFLFFTSCYTFIFYFLFNIVFLIFDDSLYLFVSLFVFSSIYFLSLSVLNVVGIIPVMITTCLTRFGNISHHYYLRVFLLFLTTFCIPSFLG